MGRIFIRWNVLSSKGIERASREREREREPSESESANLRRSRSVRAPSSTSSNPGGPSRLESASGVRGCAAHAVDVVRGPQKGP